MKTRHENTDTGSLSCGRIGAKLTLPVALFLPALMTFQAFSDGGKASRVAKNVKVAEVEKPRPKDLVRVYNIVKSNRADIADAEAWRVSQAIIEESLKRNLDAMLVLALIEIESRFQSSMISPVGARGIMQIMPETGRFLMDAVGRELGIHPATYHPESLDDPIINIRMGVYYLHGLRKQFRDLDLALIAYNGGPADLQNRLDTNQEISREFATLVLDAYTRYTNRKAPTF
jgi:soluble lytic murein transglycosylase-like protein